jgi:Ca-activated chloride channel family protein
MFIPTVVLMYLIITNKDTFEKYFDKDILTKLSISNKALTKTTRNILFFIAVILMTLALSRPVIDEKEQSFKQEVASMVIAIDVSKSMLATDLYPNRLTFAKQKVLDIIDLSKKNAIAVILFAKYSFILSPVTQDFNSLKILVNNLNTQGEFENGSNIFSTLEATNKLLKGYESKNLILLTDGGNKQDYEKEIEYANKNQINIYTIAMATENPTPIKLNDGNFMTKKDGSIVTVHLNEKIKELSFKTNGGYIHFTNSKDDIQQILKDIEKTISKKEFESKKFKTYTELFYYPLGLAIILLFIAFSSFPSLKKNTSLLLILGLFFSYTQNSEASILDFQTINKANEAYNNKDYETATKNFEKIANSSEARYNLANSLYKEGKYKEAIKNYKKVITSDKELEHKKLHNLGNSYANIGEYEKAINSYESALKIKDDKDTKDNLEEIKKLLKKNQKQQNNSNTNKNNKDKKEDKNQQKDKSKQEKNKENKTNKNKDEQNNQEKNQNNEDNKEKNQNKSDSKQNMPESKEISSLEEKKWLEQIQNQKTPVLLKKMPSKVEEENSSSTPW